MSEAEANPEAEAGATPGGEPPVNDEDTRHDIDPNDPLTGYKEPLVMAAPEGGAAVVS
jgi:hypothetical protein